MTVSESNQERDRAVAEARRVVAERQKSYRERALRMFPWVCGKCGREFAGKKVRELTVHHRDHNHDNNPPDGSNWELLCIYCHDNEHAREQDAAWLDGAPAPQAAEAVAAKHSPFAGLAELLSKKE